MLRSQYAHRVLRRVGHTETDARQVRRGVSVRADQEVDEDQPQNEELQLTGVAGGRQHGGQEARNAQVRRQYSVQVDEQIEDGIQSGYTGMVYIVG